MSRFDVSFLDSYSKRAESWGGKCVDVTAPTGRSRSSKKALADLCSVGKSPHRLALEELERKPELLKGNHEHYLQVRIFDRIDIKHPDIYEFMYCVPNGGHRAKKTGRSLKAEGQRSGVPDLALDAARGAYHGLRIELKAGSNKPTKEQIEWLNKLRRNGYCCAVLVDLEQAVQFIVDYWQLKDGQVMYALDTDKWWLDVESA